MCSCFQAAVLIIAIIMRNVCTIKKMMYDHKRMPRATQNGLCDLTLFRFSLTLNMFTYILH